MLRFFPDECGATLIRAVIGMSDGIFAYIYRAMNPARDIETRNADLDPKSRRS